MNLSNSGVRQASGRNFPEWRSHRPHVFCGAIRPRQGDWSDLWLDVIVRRLATSNRTVVTAAKWVYSTWQFQTTRRRDGETVFGDRSASKQFHMLYPAGERQELSTGVETGGSAALRKEVAAIRRGRRGDDRQHAAVLRSGGGQSRSGGGGGYQPIPGDHSIGEEHRCQRRAVIGAISVEGTVAGGTHER